MNEYEKEYTDTQYQAHLRTAYLLWLPSVFGIAGLHRLYLGKYISGIIYLFTGGLCGLGTLYDLVTMRSLVGTKYLIGKSTGVSQGPMDFFNTFTSDSPFTGRKKEDSLEVAILEYAKTNDGIIRMVDVVIKTKSPVDQVEEALNELIKNNLVEMHVSDDGDILYFCRDFMSPGAREKHQI